MGLTWTSFEPDRRWLCIAGGITAMIAGYLGVSGTLYTGEQLPYVVSGGLVGLFLLGLAALLWLSGDPRDDWRKLEAIDRHLVEFAALPLASRTANALGMERKASLL
jgi:hypothetical protein